LSVRHVHILAALSLCVSGLAWGDPPPAESSDQPPAPTGSFFSSLKQAFRQDLNYEVVRGHFDVGASPATRFYCLVDIRTGKNEEYGVGGETFVRPDGMTGIKAGAVSPDSCSKVEEQGRLVTSGYVVKLGPKATPTPSTPKAAMSAPATRDTAAPASAPPTSAAPASTAERIDVAGIRLGMSPEQVRAVLRTRLLQNYFESADTLGSSPGAHVSTRAVSGSRFVNEIGAWTAGSSDEAELYEVMFTPVPGKERVMAIVHSTRYPSGTGVSAVSLQSGLVAKYGGYAAPGELPEAPTWRLQSNGTMLTGDACGHRSVLGGLGKIDGNAPSRGNLALKTTPDEFRSQIEQCGVAIVTEDQTGSNRTVDAFTVTAYSPSIGLDGATALSQIIQATGGSSSKSAARSNEAATPTL
jgi:hypothetical protein